MLVNRVFFVIKMLTVFLFDLWDAGMLFITFS